MTEPELPELMSNLRTLAQQEQRARDELADRDERFAVLEAEMWAGFEAREVRHRELIDEHGREGDRLRGEIATREQEAAILRAEIDRLNHEAQLLHQTIAVLTEKALRTHVRLDRILSSPPARLYAALLDLPGLRYLQSWRARQYEAAIARRRPS